MIVPFPTENLGYDSKKRVAFLAPSSSPCINKKRRKKCNFLTSTPTRRSLNSDHDYYSVASNRSISTNSVCQQSYPSLTTQENNNTTLSTSVILQNSTTLLSMLAMFICFLTRSYTNNILTLLFITNRIKDNFGEVSYYTVHLLKTLLDSALDENDKLNVQINLLKKQRSKCTCKQPVWEQILKLDKDVNFYTGISKMSTFTKMHDVISKYVRKLWIGPKLTASAIKRKFNKIPNRMGPARKLNSYDQFLLTFIKLRLNVPFYDLARHFPIFVTPI